MEKDASKLRAKYRGKRPKNKTKPIDSLLFQAKKLVCRVAKVVRLYLVRKNLRAADTKKKLSPDDLKNVSCDEVAKAAMSIIEGTASWGSVDCADPYIEAVLKHRKTKEIVDEWANKIASSRKEIEDKRLKALPRKSASSVLSQRQIRQDVTKGGKQKALFVESLADVEEESHVMTKENKAWENKKRKMLRAARRDKVDLNIYMPLTERSEAASKRFTGDRLTELRNSDVSNRNKLQAQQQPAAESTELLHPSWAAKKMAKEKIAYTLSIPEGKKIIFNDDD